ncbi:hypothetical protein [Kineococcus arenarius]|uniref:hypothetical protein n=1 Tax=unclassified Kineococcus TaxID=2621656 RepID=UPI003D7C9CA7
MPPGERAAADWLRRLASRVSEQLCGDGFRGCPFINAAAEHLDPASPVRRAMDEGVEDLSAAR